MRVLAMGTWAIPHIGHAIFLRRCEAFGEVVVGVNSDRFVLAYRGAPAVYDEHERMAFMAALGYRVVLNDGPGRACVTEVRPDVIAAGTDWATRPYLEQIDVTQEWLDERGIAVVYIPARPLGISASAIRERCVR